MPKHVILSIVLLLSVSLFAAACAGDDDDDDGGGDGTPTIAASTPSESETTPVATAPPFTPRAEGTTFDDVCTRVDEKTFTAPESVIDPTMTYTATIATAKGDIVVELDSGVPTTTNNFVFLACKGFYDGLTFHRVEPGFVAQGGDPEGTGQGGPGYTIPGEFEGAVFVTGVIGMARTSDPNSAGSQFFIMLGEAPSLDGQYAAFGTVTSGQDVAGQIAVGDLIESVTITEA
jgi:cyclophilin family peptidyl-prolyl cis-trans isomerase